MSTEVYQERFGGIARLYGEREVAWLEAAHICVIGIGGVGSWAVEALARSGIGEITLIDHDDISASNSNRQLHTLESTVGRSKVAVTAERVKAINPECRCYPIDDLLVEATIERYLDQRYDYVIDAIDSISHKAAMINYCRRNKIPIITTGGAGGLSDPTAIEISDLSKTYNDPLAAKVRSTLRSRYGYTNNPKRRFSVECVFSSEQQVYPKPDGSVCQRKPGVKGATLDCNYGYGSATFVTAGFGFAAVSRVIRKLIERRIRELK